MKKIVGYYEDTHTGEIFEETQEDRVRIDFCFIMRGYFFILILLSPIIIALVLQILLWIVEHLP